MPSNIGWINKFLVVGFLVFIFTSLLPSTSYAQEWYSECAQDITDEEGNPIDTILTIACIPPLIGNLIEFAIIFAGIVAMFIIIYGGFKILRSSGEAKDIESGRNAITYGIIGLIIVFLAYFIVSLIAYTTGAGCILDFSFTGCGNPVDSP